MYACVGQERCAGEISKVSLMTQTGKNNVEVAPPPSLSLSLLPTLSLSQPYPRPPNHQVLKDICPELLGTLPLPVAHKPPTASGRMTRISTAASSKRNWVRPVTGPAT
jgi:hypothetical protein